MIRPATLDDFEGVFALGLRRALGSKRYESQRIEREASKRAFVNMTSSPMIVGLVSTDDYGLIVGYVSGCVSPQWFNDDMTASMLWLMAEKGHGAALLDAFEQACLHRGAKEIVLRIGYGERPEVYARKFKQKGYRMAGANFLKEVNHA